jgi:dTDP-4-dehydrorhamnose reductase
MIWLIGNKGMLGSDVESLLQDSDMEYLSSDLEVDITGIEQLKAFVFGKKIDYIINCAAYTAVDKAEDEPERAFRINAEGVANIATIAKEKNAVLIHISTDYVFDGEKQGPYTEEDKPNPTGVYGKSKLEGELHIQNILKQYYIVRTAWLYGLHGKNFIYTMLRLFKEKESLKVVSDQWGSPTYTRDLAEVIIKIINSKSSEYGIYHFTNVGRTNWYQFAKSIHTRAKEIGIITRDIDLLPVTTWEYPTKAKRPQNSYLSKDKIKTVFDFHITQWEDALNNFLNKLKSTGAAI